MSEDSVQAPSVSGVVILAAGLGTRMKSDLPKVLHQVCGRPMLAYVLEAAAALRPERLVVVLGHGHELVRPVVPPEAAVVLQEPQLGTGHALLCAEQAVPAGDVVVIGGDTPLLTGQELVRMVAAHHASGADATVLSMVLPDPTGYGRVVRDADGRVARIVEHRDATEVERCITEVNSGMYVLPAPRIFEALHRVGRDNAQGEIYLTDAVALLRSEGLHVGAVVTQDPDALRGVNSPQELAHVEDLMRARARGVVSY